MVLTPMAFQYGRVASVMSGASTYAVGQVAVTHFGSKADLMDIDLDWAKKAYSELFEKGKEVVSDLKDKETESKDVYESLEKLGRLKEQGVVTDAEFEAQKHKLLERL